MARILIAGCGDIGSGLGLALSRAGHQCLGLRRDTSQLPAPIQGIAADLSQPLRPGLLPPDLDLVVYALAAPTYDAGTYQATYVDGLARLIEALEQRSASNPQLIFVSSTAVYHQQDGEWVDESSPTEPRGFSGQAMLAAERLLAEAPLTGTAVRFSGIYGPGRERLIRWVKEGLAPRPEPVHYGNRIHREDCLGVLQHLAERALAGTPLAGCYLASDPQPASYQEVLEWLRQGLHLPEPETRVDLSQKLRTGSKRCYPRRLLAEGYEFRYPDYRAGFASMLEQS